MKKILLVNESSVMGTGLGRIGHNFLSCMQDRGYEVAELACGIKYREEVDAKIPWVVYYNSPFNEKEQQVYNSHPENIYGKWRFDLACADFKPDYVFNVNDPWTSYFMGISPLRDFFNLCLIPTIDSYPLKTRYLANIETCDTLFLYSEWARAGFQKQADVVRYGVDPLQYSIFSNRDEIQRKTFGDKLVIGTVMKNQSRKSFGDLFEAIKKAKEISKVPFVFYCHTSYPDADSWEIPDLLLQYGIADITYFTYVCPECGKWYPSLYKGGFSHCQKCPGKAYIKVGSLNLDENEMNELYNLFDVYVQYSTAEGACIPIGEAGAAGCMLAYSYNTACEDYIQTLGGLPLYPLKYSYNMKQQSFRAIMNPDRDGVRLADLLSLGRPALAEMGRTIRNNVIKHYSWINFCAVIDDRLKTLEPSKLKWDDRTPELQQVGDFNIEKLIDIYEYLGFRNKLDVTSLLKDYFHRDNKFSRYITMTRKEDIHHMINGYIRYYNTVRNLRFVDINQEFIKIAQNKRKKLHEQTLRKS